MSQRGRESIEETEVDDGDDEIQQQQPPKNKNKNKNKNKKKKKKKKKDGENKDGFERKLRGAKDLILLPFKKFEKVFTKNKRSPPPPPFPYSEEIGSKGCYLCFMQPKTLSDSPLRPNPGAKASSYHDFLRSLIEENDFYSPECNVHTEK